VVLAAAVLVAVAVSAGAQDAFEGLTLISQLNSFNSFLIDMDETVVITWHGDERPASIAYLLPNGSCLRPCKDGGGQFQGGGVGGRLQWFDAEDNLTWDFYFSNYSHQQHHDIEPMPNGNVLLIAWERKTQQEAIAAGRQIISGEMWPTLIAEIEPVGATGGTVVWEWHLWDHLVQDADPSKPNYGVVADHPELMNINYGNVGGPQGGGDWLHANAIHYNEELDQITFSSRPWGEIYVIDHSTTTAEAAGHTGGNSGMGGDILYRWGNPQAYDRGTSSDQQFYAPHGVNWIDPGLPGEGNLLIFNNGDRPGTANDYSSVEEIVPPLNQNGTYYIAPDSAFGPSAPTWTYSNPAIFYSPTQSGAYRLPNGNTLVCDADDGYVFEVTESGTTVWDYDNPANVPRAPRYWMSIWGRLAGGSLELRWSYRHGAAAYWAYGADNQVYFEPGLASPYEHRQAVLPSGTTTWSSANGVGDPDHNWTYLVVAVDQTGQELCRSDRFGEHDFGTAIGGLGD
jgi:hypothetical protein